METKLTRKFGEDATVTKHGFEIRRGDARSASLCGDADAGEVHLEPTRHVVNSRWDHHVDFVRSGQPIVLTSPLSALYLGRARATR